MTFCITPLVDRSGMRSQGVTVVHDLGSCSGCQATNDGTPGTLGWSASPYRGSAVAAGQSYGVDPRLVYGIFLQETSGSNITQNATMNLMQLFRGGGSLGPTNLTVGSISDVLSLDRELRRYVALRIIADPFLQQSSVPQAAALMLIATGSSADPDFVASITASRLKSLEIEVRAKANGQRFVSRKDLGPALAGNGKAAYLSSVVGAAYNAQSGSSTAARSAGRGQVLEALLGGNFNNSTPAVANNSGNPNLYKNQYTDSFCKAASQIKGGRSC